MFRSLRSRMLATFTVIVTLTVLVVSLISAGLLRQSAERQIRNELRREALALAELYSLQAETAASEGRPSPRFAIGGLQRLAGARIYYTGSSLFPGEDAELEEPDGLELSEEQIRSIEPTHPRSVRWSDDGEEHFGYAAAVGLSDQVVGALVVARPNSDLTAQWRPLALRVGLALAAAWLLAWIVAMALSRRITKPLGQLSAAARTIALGRYHAKELESIQSNDEIGQLAAAFTEMTHRLREVDARDRRFLMSISHELRTPLTAIEGHAQAIQDGLTEDPESMNRSLAVIMREAGRLERLVDDIIDLARLRSNRFNTVTERVYLNELGEHLLAIFEERGMSEIELSATFETIAFYSDGQRILQILRNLINNALRHASSSVVVTGRRTSASIAIEVFNDGDPVATDMRERIFEPFVGDKREGGMGLGLAIGRELAWALGGNLAYIDRSDGAAFELTLPIEPPSSGR